MKKLITLNSDDLIFIDVESVKCEKELTEDSTMYDAWSYKMRHNSEKNKFDSDNYELTQLFDEKASLFAPFSKIVCISIGKIIRKEDNTEFIKLHSIYNHDEKKLLHDFNVMVGKFYDKNNNITFVGFNSNYFDMPLIIKRMLVNGVKFHTILDKSGLKPWEIRDVDLCDLWKGTSYYPDSLMSVTAALSIKSPKSDIDGSQVSNVYWDTPEEITRIAKYCEHDVEATINVYRRFIFKPIIEDVVFSIK